MTLLGQNVNSYVDNSEVMHFTESTRERIEVPDACCAATADSHPSTSSAPTATAFTSPSPASPSPIASSPYAPPSSIPPDSSPSSIPPHSAHVSPAKEHTGRAFESAAHKQEPAVAKNSIPRVDVAAARPVRLSNEGFRTVYRPKQARRHFADLLAAVGMEKLLKKNVFIPEDYFKKQLFQK